MISQELMIGDWVDIYTFPNDNPKAEDLYHAKIVSILDGLPTEQLHTIECIIPHNDGGYGVASRPADTCLPIPLTPEILEKNGFIKEDTWSGIFTMKYCFYEEGAIKYEELNFDKKIVIEVEFSASDNHIRHINIYCFIENGCADVHICKADQNFFVHELQHALKLCKIDKEIEL